MPLNFDETTIHSHQCQNCNKLIDCFNPLHFNHKTDELTVPWEIEKCHNCIEFESEYVIKYE